MLAKRTYKNQITIPKEVIDQIGDPEYFDVFLREDEIVLKPVEITGTGERLARVRQKVKALGLGDQDIEEAIHWVRKQARSS